MNCYNAPCNWHYCQTNTKCFLHVQETRKENNIEANKSKPVIKVEVDIKTKRKSSKSLKRKLIPIVSCENIDDNLYRCHYCEKELSYKDITVDHKNPLSEGGTNSKYNLAPSCYECNIKKGSIPYKQFIKQMTKL